MTDFSVVKAYDRILQSYQELQESIAGLVRAPGLKHSSIWDKIGFKKDTFYRRLRLQDWTYPELKTLLPFLIKNIKKNDPALYERLLPEQMLELPVQNDSPSLHEFVFVYDFLSFRKLIYC